MSTTPYINAAEVDLKPKKHHGYAVLLFIVGTLLPPLAVAARFGIGKDFWINMVLTLCGYIPGHGHNFYIQNIRNNKTHARTPKWVQKYGLVDTSEIKRKERKSQWARRYNDRLPRSALEGQALAEGQEGASSIDLSEENGSRPQRNPNGELWRPEEERFYNADSQAASSGRWHYPTNFHDAEPLDVEPLSKPKKKKKKDRWERTQDAYAAPATEIDSGKKKKRRKRTKSMTASDTTSNPDLASEEFPEDPEGGLYGPSRAERERTPQNTTDDVFKHQF